VPAAEQQGVVENVSVVLRGFRASPLTAGLLLTMIPIALGLVAPLSGGLSDRLGAQPLIVSGMVLAAAAPVGLALVMRTTALLPLLIPPSRLWGGPGPVYGAQQQRHQMTRDIGVLLAARAFMSAARALLSRALVSIR
jgi:MFS family permease